MLHPHIYIYFVFFREKKLSKHHSLGEANKIKEDSRWFAVFVLLSFGKNVFPFIHFTKISQGRHIYSRIFFGLLRIAHEFIIRGRNKGLYKNVFPWGCFNNNIIQITYFEKYETRKPALIISNYYRRYFPAYEWLKMEKCMG